ncbi:sulfite exporter TauE/SafE family protein [Methylocaldum sp.]|uniref:sulfite exporter TauE/SafE family protein n=1 Tax=Methylocaldum sp. TaxID=1969727 RepID=UPI002D501AA0|nr:sulfite exporter TauE/SafE family protein [Methylocaldum sp.]HYE34459.1 sulfite exporter TauE/SafE family protein [Methylocaldum sp.]
MTLVVALSLLIGLLLGLLGGGGSILTVPVLVYLLRVEPKTAIATSLVVVGVASLAATLNHARNGRVCWRTGLIFGAAGMLGAYGGGRLAAYVPGGVLLLLFAVIMFATALAMLRGQRQRGAETGASKPICPANLPLLAIMFDGLMVGVVTGLVGAGGGFLVVPALNLLGGLPMHAAIGTSLLVIATKSFAGLAGYISHVSIDLELVSIVTGVAIVGSLIGGLLSRHVSGQALRRIFGGFVIAIACYLLYKELTPELIAETRELLLQHPDFLWGMATMLGIVAVCRVWGWIHTQGLHRKNSFTLNPTNGAKR